MTMDNMRMARALQLNCGNVSATGAGTELDLQKYFVSPGKREMKAVYGAVWDGASSDSGTITYKLQESADTVDSNFSDISGAAFTVQGDSDTAALQEIHFFTNKRFVRGYSTLTGTAIYDVVVTLFALKRDM